jgi:ABC-type uncharacterized transport system substrate-binding protein
LKRRDLLIRLGAGSLANLASVRRGWPQSAWGKRRIGVLTWWADADPESLSQAPALAEGLAAFGWVEDSNIKIDYRRTSGEPTRMGTLAKESLALRPEVLVGITTPAVTALVAEAQTIPIIFTAITAHIPSI